MCLCAPGTNSACVRSVRRNEDKYGCICNYRRIKRNRHAKTKELLEADGSRVINIDLKDGDICVNLASEAGRQKAIDELHRLCPMDWTV